MALTDSYPNSIESPQRIYLQYSQDITFDYSTGKYPTGLESGFIWEDYYIPIPHEIRGISVGGHVWQRQKLGTNGTWTLPQPLGITSGSITENVTTIINNLKSESPLYIENEILKHLDTEGNKHIPSGGEDGQLLSKFGSEYVWIESSEFLVDTYTKLELNNGVLNTIYYTEGEVNSFLANYYTENEINSFLTNYYTITQLNTGQLDNRYYTEIELNIGQLDNRYYTETELDSGILNTIYYTETELQTSGQSNVHWDNITDAPTFLENSLNQYYMWIGNASNIPTQTPLPLNTNFVRTNLAGELTHANLSQFNILVGDENNLPIEKLLPLNINIVGINGTGDFIDMSEDVSITGGTITGITDIAVVDGGTGASIPSDARINLGILPPISLSQPFQNGWEGTFTYTTDILGMTCLNLIITTKGLTKELFAIGIFLVTEDYYFPIRQISTDAIILNCFLKISTTGAIEFTNLTAATNDMTCTGVFRNNLLI